MEENKAPAHILHSIFFLLFPVSFLITYTVSFQFNHIRLWIPYISDTGSTQPESSIFSILLSLCAVVFGFCVYIRYLQIANYTFNNTFARVSEQLNIVATILGEIAALGLLTVANFQETKCYYPHFTGATACILCGSAYFVFETWISFNMKEEISSTVIYHIRIFIAVLVILLNVVGIISTVVSIMNSPQEIRNYSRPWLPTDDGWIAHVISAGCEWLLAFSQSLMMLSFVPELRTLEVVLPVLRIKGISDSI